MSAAEQPPHPSRASTFFRVWLPWVLIAVGVAAFWAIWSAPGDITPVLRTLGTVVVDGLVIVGLLAWFFFLSGAGRETRLAALVVLLAAGAGAFFAIKKIDFSGDMIPTGVRWVWQSDPASGRQAHHEKVGGAGLLAGPVEVTATDYPGYRGANLDGVITGPAISRDWDKNPPRIVWQQPVGDGHASIAVAGPMAVTVEQIGDNESVVCYDTATGRQRWAYTYPARFDLEDFLGGDGPRATPTIAGGDVYSVGATGILVCLDARTGEKKWQVDTLAGIDNIKWGMTSSPLVYDDVVVVSPGCQNGEGHTLVAYNRADGKKVWASGQAQASYSSPMLATIDGTRQVVLLDAEGLAGYDAEGGEQLWRIELTDIWPNYFTKNSEKISVAQPWVFDDGRVLISLGYFVGSQMLRVAHDAGGDWSVRQVWDSPSSRLRCKFTSPVVHKGYIYGLNEGRLVCLDAADGKLKWTGEPYGHGQILLIDDLLLVQTEQPGELALVAASPDGFRELGRFPVFDERTWNHLAMADGRVYLRNHKEMACIDLRADKSASPESAADTGK